MGVGPCAQRPYPSSGSGTFLPTRGPQGVPTSHAAGLRVTRLRSFGASFPIVPSAEAGGGGGAWGFVAAGVHRGDALPPSVFSGRS